MSTSKLELKVNGFTIIKNKGTYEISKPKAGFEKYRAMVLSDGSFIISGEYVGNQLNHLFSIPYHLEENQEKWKQDYTSDLQDPWLRERMPNEVDSSMQEWKMFSALLRAYGLKKKK